MRKEIREVLDRLATKAVEVVPSTLNNQGLDEYVNSVLEILKNSGMKGEVKAHVHPAIMMPEEDVSFDNFDTVFTREDKKQKEEICLNGLEDIVYGKESTHFIVPKKGWIIFISEEL